MFSASILKTYFDTTLPDIHNEKQFRTKGIGRSIAPIQLLAPTNLSSAGICLFINTSNASSKLVVYVVIKISSNFNLIFPKTRREKVGLSGSG
jgi:hypothetical protein